jgi:hypothetical protein
MSYVINFGVISTIVLFSLSAQETKVDKTSQGERVRIPEPFAHEQLRRRFGEKKIVEK